MDFAQHWVFGGGPGIWSSYILAYAIGTVGFIAFNHQRFAEKLLNTFKFGWAFIIAMWVSTSNIVYWGEEARIMLPLVQLGWVMVLVWLSDWTAFIIWCIATSKHTRKDTAFYRAVMKVRAIGQRARALFVKLPEDAVEA